MGQISSRPVLADTSKMGSWDIPKTSIDDGEYSKSPVITQENENFVAFYRRSTNTISVFCCSAEQWHYDEIFTFNIKIVSDPDQIVVFQTTAAFSKKHPYCAIILTDKVPDVVFVQVQICSNYPYTRKDRFLGIRNSGSTCYMASILQILFHTTAFRNLIYSFKDPPEAVAALQQLFIELQLSSRAPSPDSFIRTLGSVQELAAVQHDAHEFFIALLERLEADLGNPFKQPEQQIFKGTIRRTIECASIDYKSSNEEEFMTMPIIVDGLKSLQESLSLMTASEHLSDEYDAGEKGKASATQKQLFSKLPPILAMQLCRFKYNAKTNSVIEIKSTFTCPFELDMAQFSIEDVGEETNYELYGITAHSGNPVFGHYTSFLRPGLGEQWIQFNDGSTKVVDQQQVSRLFGTSAQNQPSFFRAFSFSSAVAYMLFYVRKDCLSFVSTSDSIPLHLAPHRSNLFFSKFFFYEDIPDSPISNNDHPYEWLNPQETIANILKKIHPTKEIDGYSAWAQLPGRAEFVGPLTLNVPASQFVIKGHSTTFYMLPHEFDDGPVFLATSKLPKKYIGVTTAKEALSIVPQNLIPRYQLRTLSETSPLYQPEMMLTPGSTFVAEPHNTIIIKISNRRYIFPSSATYSDVQKRVSMETGIAPSRIFFLNGSSPLKPRSYPFASQFPTTMLSYQVLQEDVTACSISLFTPLKIVYISHQMTRELKEPRWVRKGTTVSQIIDLAPTMFPGARWGEKMKVIVSKGVKEKCKEILSPYDTPLNDSFRIDVIRHEAPYTRSALKALTKSEQPISIEVRYATNTFLESFQGISHFFTIMKSTTVRELLKKVSHVDNSIQEQTPQVIAFISEKIKIHESLGIDTEIYPVIKLLVTKMTKPNQRVCLVIVTEDPLINKPTNLIPRSLSGLLNPSNKFSE